MTRRLVIVANRVPNPKERGATAGGLAVALQDAVAQREAMWFGWSGQTASIGLSGQASISPPVLPIAERIRSTHPTV